MDVTLQDAFTEACRALGESKVRENLLSAQNAQLSAEVEALRAASESPAIDLSDPTTWPVSDEIQQQALEGMASSD